MAIKAKTGGKTKASKPMKAEQESKKATPTPKSEVAAVEKVAENPATESTAIASTTLSTVTEQKPVKAAKAVKPEKKTDKAKLILELSDKFKEIKEILVSISDTKKQPRQLRFAIQQIDMAERAAGRAITHVA